MNLYNKQTRLGIVVLLLAFGLIIGGSIAGYSSVQESKEDRKNEATVQQYESEGVSASPITPIGSGELVSTLGQSQTWPDVGDGHCLLVLVNPPHNEPDDLTNENTIRLPLDYCWAITKSIRGLVAEGLLNPEDLIFKQTF